MRPLPALVIALGVVSLLTDVSSEMIMPLLPALIMGGMGGGAFAVGIVDGIADALSAVLKMVAGGLSDRSPRRKPFVLFGYGFSTVVRPMISLATAPWHIVAVRALDRVGKGVRTAPRDALIADAVPKEDAGRAYAFHRMMDHSGAIVGPLVATALMAAGLTIRQCIAAAWVPGVLAVIALAIFAKEKPRAASEVIHKKEKIPLPRSLYVVVGVCGLFALGVAGDTFLLVRARDLGMAEPLLPILWSVLHVAKVAAARTVGRVNPTSRFVVVGAWIVGAVALALLTVDDVRIVWPAALLFGACHGTREPIEKVLVRASAPDAARGSAFGAYHLTTGLLALPSGLAIGGLWQQVSGPTALWVSAGAVVVAAIFLAALRGVGGDPPHRLDEKPLAR